VHESETSTKYCGCGRGGGGGGSNSDDSGGGGEQQVVVIHTRTHGTTHTYAHTLTS